MDQVRVVRVCQLEVSNEGGDVRRTGLEGGAHELVHRLVDGRAVARAQRVAGRLRILLTNVRLSPPFCLGEVPYIATLCRADVIGRGLFLKP